MFEFLITLMMCDDPNVREGCQVTHQWYKTYESASECVQIELDAFDDYLIDQVRQGKLTEEDRTIIKSATLLHCAPERRVHAA